MIKFNEEFEKKLKRVDSLIVKSIRENAKIQNFEDYSKIECLADAFLWCNSSEGYEYWFKVEKKYNI